MPMPDLTPGYERMVASLVNVSHAVWGIQADWMKPTHLSVSQSTVLHKGHTLVSS